MVQQSDRSQPIDLLNWGCLFVCLMLLGFFVFFLFFGGGGGGGLKFFL